MVKTYIKYISLSLAITLCTAIGAFGQQKDTTEAQKDSGEQQTVTDSAVSAVPDEDTADLKKFALKENGYKATERKAPPAEVKKITSGDDFWYANKINNPEVKKNDEEGGFWANFFRVLTSRAFRLVFWIIVIGCFIAILAMYLANNKVWLFAPRTRRIKGEEVQADDTGGNIFQMDFDSRINKALEQYDYRLATRLLFLRLLRSMAERNIIKYSIEKTNLDYLFELGNTRYSKDFSTASRNYEYVWYGNFDIQQSQFNQLKQRLEELNQQINN